MKILVIGLGSMGQRRIRLLKKIQPDIEITAVESDNSRCVKVAKELNILCCSDIDSVNIRDYNGIIISTSPLTHCSLIKRLLDYDLPIFTELNLVSDGYEVFKQNEDRLFLSSTLMYRKDLQYIQERVDKRRVNYNYHVGQYLPDWHPWESYKQYFVNNKRTNGCREIMAIEFPWIVSCFGNVTGMHVIKDKMTELDIDYNDNYLIMLEHETGTRGVITVDVVSRKAIRRLEIFSEEIHIFWDGTPQSLTEYNLEKKIMENIAVYNTVEHNALYSENIIEDAYQEELNAFLQMIRQNDRSLVRYSFSKDEQILQLIDKTEN